MNNVKVLKQRYSCPLNQELTEEDSDADLEVNLGNHQEDHHQQQQQQQQQTQQQQQQQQQQPQQALERRTR